MKQQDVPAAGNIRDALVSGLPGDFRIDINGERLHATGGHQRRFVTIDAAVKALARSGILGCRVEVSHV